MEGRWRGLAAIFLGVLAGCSAAPAAVSRAAPGAPVFTVPPGKLSHPMALAFLPDARLIVGQGDGKLMLRQPDGSVGVLPGMPASSMLRDIAVMPGPGGASIVYFAYDETKAAGGGLALGRGVIAGASL